MDDMARPLTIPWRILFCVFDLFNIGETDACKGTDRLATISPGHQHEPEVPMICRPEIRRRFLTRDEAHRYLSARGFLFLPQGWANGRWTASLEGDASGFALTIALSSDMVPTGRTAVRPDKSRKLCTKAQETSRKISLLP